MKIVVNGTPKEVEATALSDALEELGYRSEALATALNECFVPKGRRNQVELTEGDRLEIVAPMQGG